MATVNPDNSSRAAARSRSIVLRTVVRLSGVFVVGLMLSGVLSFGQAFPPPAIQWQRRLAASAWESQKLPDNSVVLAGYVIRTNIDFYVARIDAAGQVLWERQLGGSGYDDAYDVRPASDGGFIVVGRSESGATGDKSADNFGWSDYWVVHLDSAGRKTWDATIGGTWNDLPRAVIELEDSSIIIAGESYSPADGNKTARQIGRWDAWFVRLSADGSNIWDQTFGGLDNDGVYSVVSASNRVVFAGYSESQTNITKTATAYGTWDVWVGSLDAEGTLLWDRSYGGAGFDYAEKIQLTLDGGFIIAGYSASAPGGNKTSSHFGGGDGWAIRLDSAGNKIWERSYGSTNHESFYSVDAIADGGFIFSGIQRGDFWVVRTDTSGNKLWEQTFPAPYLDRAHAVAALADGSYLVSGILDIDGPEETWLLRLQQDSPMLRLGKSVGNDLSLFLNGTSNDYAIEFSTDLLSWSRWSTNSVATTGSETSLVAPANDPAGRRFYRARLIP